MAISGYTGLTADAVVSKINEWAETNSYDVTAEKTHATVANTGLKVLDGDGNVLFTTYTGTGSNGYMYVNNGNSSFNLVGIGGSGETDDIYFSSRGFLLKIVNSGYTVLVMLTVNDDGSIITARANGQTGTSIACMRYADSDGQTIAYTANSGNSTTLCNMIALGSVGTDSSAQYAYFMPIRQYSDAGIITLNDEQYITNGYWCIKD